jgi:hypothetical protein
MPPYNKIQRKCIQFIYLIMTVFYKTCKQKENNKKLRKKEGIIFIYCPSQFKVDNSNVLTEPVLPIKKVKLLCDNVVCLW